MSHHYHLYDIMERDLLFPMPSQLGSKYLLQLFVRDEGKYSLFINGIRCVTLQEGPSVSIWMAALNLRPHSHQYIDVQPLGSCLQASLWTNPAQTLYCQLITPAAVHITLYYLPENVVLRNGNVCRNLAYTMTPYNGATCIIPKRLYKLVIWYGEINTMAVYGIITRVHAYLFIRPFHSR